jgi:hypothetical protein
MNKQLQASIMAAVLLAGGTVYSLHYFGIARPGQDVAAPRTDDIAIAHSRSAMVSCQEAARMFYDVKWAAACMAQADGDPECDLPDDKAAVINAWLNEAEKRCRVEVRASHP